MTDEFDALLFEAQEPARRPEVGDIEQALLAGLFAGEPEAVARIIAGTRPGDFYFGNHRELAALIYPPLSRGEHVDGVTVAAALPEAKDDKEREAQKAFLAHVDQIIAADPPSIGKVDAYLGYFVESARLRLAKHMVDKAGRALEEGLITPQEAAARIFNTVAELEASRRLVGAFMSEGDEWATYFAALEAFQDHTRNVDFTGLDSGFNHFNRVTNGLGPALYVIGAAPGTGKTTWAKQVADHVVEAHDGAAVLFVSLEQSKEELRLKTLSRLSGVENRDIRRGRQDVDASGWRRVKEASEAHRKTADRFFILEGDRNTTPDRIRLAALQVKRKTEVEDLLVVVDYLQIVPTESEFRDTRNKVDFVVSELRRLARDLHCPVIAISSVSRASYGSSPGLDAFKESGGVEFTADVGLVMYKDKDKVKGTDTVEGVGRDWEMVYVNVVKNRFGERARIAFKYFAQIDRFVEGDKEALNDE